MTTRGARPAAHNGANNGPTDGTGAPPPPVNAALRLLPSVDEVLRALAMEPLAGGMSHEALAQAARTALAQARAEMLAAGAATPAEATEAADTSTTALCDAVVARAATLLTRQQRPALRPVINATGVILNTNLGRAPLSDAAVAAMVAVARGASNLEYDLERGGRGSRQTPIRALLREVTGAEDALVVNNNAAAVLVVLATLATGREVIISRGELVEIGGGFRVPDVLRQSGAQLVEVGTTNRTRVADYEQALTPATALLLAVHPSNFRVVGFTEAPELSALATLAHAHGLPLVHDLGSGCLRPTERWGLAHEPTVQESIAAGVDIVCFSGDKLLGGPQSGLIVGRAALLQSIARHPLMRVMRIDKLTLAALEATLRQHRDGLAEREIPIWQAMATPAEELRRRAEQWAAAVRAWGHAADIVEGRSTVGGGSLPGETLPTSLCVIDAPIQTVPIGAASDSPRDARQDAAQDAVARLATRLRLGAPAVVARISRDQLLLDPRTVRPDEDESLLLALHNALQLPNAATPAE